MQDPNVITKQQSISLRYSLNVQRQNRVACILTWFCMWCNKVEIQVGWHQGKAKYKIRMSTTWIILFHMCSPLAGQVINDRMGNTFTWIGVHLHQAFSLRHLLWLVNCCCNNLWPIPVVELLRILYVYFMKKVWNFVRIFNTYYRRSGPILELTLVTFRHWLRIICFTKKYKIECCGYTVWTGGSIQSENDNFDEIHAHKSKIFWGKMLKDFFLSIWSPRCKLWKGPCWVLLSPEYVQFKLWCYKRYLFLNYFMSPNIEQTKVTKWSMFESTCLSNTTIYSNYDNAKWYKNDIATCL